MTDEDATIRSKALSYLAAVVAALPLTYLSRQQIQVLCQFLCDRLDDGTPAVAGLIRLQEMGRFNSETAVMTIRA